MHSYYDHKWVATEVTIYFSSKAYPKRMLNQNSQVHGIFGASFNQLLHLSKCWIMLIMINLTCVSVGSKFQGSQNVN